jgi:hypothetical protein
MFVQNVGPGLGGIFLGRNFNLIRMFVFRRVQGDLVLICKWFNQNSVPIIFKGFSKIAVGTNVVAPERTKY